MFNLIKKEKIILLYLGQFKKSSFLPLCFILQPSLRIVFQIILSLKEFTQVWQMKSILWKDFDQVNEDHQSLIFHFPQNFKTFDSCSIKEFWLALDYKFYPLKTKSRGDCSQYWKLQYLGTLQNVMCHASLLINHILHWSKKLLMA